MADKKPTVGERQADALEVIGERLVRPPAPREVRGYVSDLGRFPALRIALAVCVHVRGVGDVDGLVQRFKRVPDSYVNRAERAVRCVCGASVPFGDLRACPGQSDGCGRFFAADELGAFAVKFTADELAA